jgi:glutaredoxin 3
LRAGVLYAGLAMVVVATVVTRAGYIAVRDAVHARAVAAAETANDGPKVVIYTTQSCPYCKRAKALLRSRGVAFEEKDVEENRANAAAARALSGRGGVPVIDIDGQVISGFDERAMVSALDNATKKRAGG